jgi:hypothetical protein
VSLIGLLAGFSKSYMIIQFPRIMKSNAHSTSRILLLLVFLIGSLPNTKDYGSSQRRLARMFSVIHMLCVLMIQTEWYLSTGSTENSGSVGILYRSRRLRLYNEEIN